MVTDRSVSMEELVKHLSRCQHMGWMNVIGELTCTQDLRVEFNLRTESPDGS